MAYLVRLQWTGGVDRRGRPPVRHKYFSDELFVVLTMTISYTLCIGPGRVLRTLDIRDIKAVLQADLAQPGWCDPHYLSSAWSGQLVLQPVGAAEWPL